MVAKTPTDALSMVPAGSDKTAIISAADALIAAVDAAVAGNTQTWTVVVGGTPTSGTYTITVTDPVNGARTTSSLAHNASGAAVQAALRLLSGVGMNLTTVAQTGSTPNFTNTIQFKGTLCTSTVTVTSSLTGGTPTLVPTETATYSKKISNAGADLFEENLVNELEVLATNMKV
jgi:hypothetical protein